MPQLIFKGVSIDAVESMSDYLAEKLSAVDNTPSDYFTFEVPRTMFFKYGKKDQMYPLVQVLAFERDHKIEAKMANIIAEAVKEEGYEQCEVFFLHIGQNDYYEF